MAKSSTWKSQEERPFQTKLRKTVPHVSENQEITARAAAAPPDFSHFQGWERKPTQQQLTAAASGPRSPDRSTPLQGP